MKFKGIFFDLYGTLLIYTNNTKAWADWIEAFYNTLKKYGLSLSKEKFKLKCDGFMGKKEPNVEIDGLTIYEHRIRRLCRELDLHLNETELRCVAEASVNAWDKYIVIDPMSIPILKEFKNNRKIALISNFDFPPHIYSTLDDMNLYEFFDSIVISGEVGVKKPNPQIFSYALEETNLNSDDVIYIGDAPEDIQGAKAAGIYPILIDRKQLFSDSSLTDYNTNQISINYDPNSSVFKNVKKISSLKELFEIV